MHVGRQQKTPPPERHLPGSAQAAGYPQSQFTRESVNGKATPSSKTMRNGEYKKSRRGTDYLARSSMRAEWKIIDAKSLGRR